MTHEILDRIYKLYDFFCSYYNLSNNILFIWQVIGGIFFILLCVSIIYFIKDTVVFLSSYKSKVIFMWGQTTSKLKQLWNDIDFFRYVRKARPLYKENILSFQKIDSKEIEKNHIGGVNALLQTNWQFKRKKNGKYTVREPEHLGLREVIEDNSLINLAIAGKIEITEINLNTGKDFYYVSLIIRNMTGEKLSFFVPKGQVFENEDVNAKTQNLASQNRYRYDIERDCAYIKIEVPCFCLNQNMDIPKGGKGKITIFEVIFKDFNDQNQLWKLMSYQNNIVKAEGFTNDSKPDLLKSIINASQSLQGMGKSLQNDEDSRNGHIAYTLNIKGFKAKDQTRWGVSETGNRAGEIDIKIDDNDNNTLAICEAFNLNCCNSKIITSHLTKIFGYDVNGLENNFILVYSEAKDYMGLWNKYLQFIQNMNYPYELTSEIQDISAKHSPYSDIKICVSNHNRNNAITNLYHIFVNMNFAV